MRFDQILRKWLYFFRNFYRIDILKEKPYKKSNESWKNLLVIYLIPFSDIAIQSIVLGAPWFQASKSLCAYISCAALREVDTSRIISEVLSKPVEGVFCIALSVIYV